MDSLGIRKFLRFFRIFQKIKIFEIVEILGKTAFKDLEDFLVAQPFSLVSSLP